MQLLSKYIFCHPQESASDSCFPVAVQEWIINLLPQALIKQLSASDSLVCLNCHTMFTYICFHLETVGTSDFGISQLLSSHEQCVEVTMSFFC